MKGNARRTGFLVACVAPAVILFTIFMIVPTINVFRMSLYERSAFSATETFVGLKNFTTLLNDAAFIRSMQNTLLLIVVVTVITMSFALVFAYILTKEHLKGQNFFRVVFYIPNILSVVVISGIFAAVYQTDNGMLNSIIDAFFNLKEAILWKGEKMVMTSV
ncbi:MAG: sugar ABC transporter permease, partial [Oscillospiraceae bacterium]|nr:sugar ABC transporter permease [Oscillospiraceae bacterium]